MIGTVKGHEFRKNKEGAENVIMLSVEITEAEDVQSIQLYTQVGDESIPSVGDQVIIVNITNSWRIAIATKDNIVPSMLVGEKKLYSVDENRAIAAFINFLNTGILELNGNTNFAVKYTELETAFNQLQQDHDDFVTTYNSHTHIETGGTTNAPLPTGSPSTADIAPAKSTEVLL